MKRLKQKFIAATSAFKAGWIVSQCKTGCIADDQTETIRPCFLHEPEIARLGKINEANPW